MTVKAQKIGNSIMVTIPKQLSDEFGIVPGTEISFKKEKLELRIIPYLKKARKFSDFAGMLKAPSNFNFKKVIKDMKESGYDR